MRKQILLTFAITCYVFGDDWPSGFNKSFGVDEIRQLKEKIKSNEFFKKGAVNVYLDPHNSPIIGRSSPEEIYQNPSVKYTLIYPDLSKVLKVEKGDKSIFEIKYVSYIGIISLSLETNNSVLFLVSIEGEKTLIDEEGVILKNSDKLLEQLSQLSNSTLTSVFSKTKNTDKKEKK